MCTKKENNKVVATISRVLQVLFSSCSSVYFKFQHHMEKREEKQRKKKFFQEHGNNGRGNINISLPCMFALLSRPSVQDKHKFCTPSLFNFQYTSLPSYGDKLFDKFARKAKFMSLHSQLQHSVSFS